jgi:acetyl esterase/lipase
MGSLRRVLPPVLALVLLASCSDGGRADSGERPAAADATGTTACVEAPTGRSTHRYAERPGTPAERTSLDVYHPGGCEPVPIVVWIHGGGWRRGDKRGAGVEQKAELASRLGAALVAVNYRLSTPSANVRWPDHGTDVADAIAWVQLQGPRLGLDPTRTALLGHSAGAHLAAIVATDPGLLDGAGVPDGTVDCVVALDSAAFELAGSPAQASGLVANAFGDDADVLDAASPLVRVRRDGPPTADMLVVTRGGPARIAAQRELVDAVTDSGGSAELLDVNPYDHLEVNRLLGAERETRVTQPVARFLERCLGS